MRTPRDTALRIAHEARIQSQAGLRTGFLHLPVPSLKASFIHPEIDACVRGDWPSHRSAPPSAACAAKLLSDSCAACRAGRLSLARLRGSSRACSRRRRSTAATALDVAAADRALRRGFGGRVTWAAVNGRVRRGLEAGNAGIDLWPEDWRPAVAGAGAASRRP